MASTSSSANTFYQSAHISDTQSERSPAFTTTCHHPDECAICNIYADHFDTTSLLSRLDPTDPYTQGLQQGIALRTHEIDTEVSRYRSQLAASHLKLQNFQSESTARQIEIQNLRTQATRHAMEIELLKRELALERDRTMALETACDELEVELADERRKTIDNQILSASTSNAQEEDSDWVLNWDDDWEKYELESSKETLDDLDFATTSSSSSHRDEIQSEFTSSTPSEDWGWIYDLDINNGGAGFYWEDYQESPSSFDRNWNSLLVQAEDVSSKAGPSKAHASPSPNWEPMVPATTIGGNDDDISSHGSNPDPNTHSIPSHPEPKISHDQEDTGSLSEPTLNEVIKLIAIASSITSTTSESAEKSDSSPLTREAALNRIRSLIQEAERTPRHRRSEAQGWLLRNWRRPPPTNRPVIQLKAPSHPTLDLPSIPEIYVDASESGVGVYLPLLPYSSLTPGHNPSQWLAYRWSEKRHPSMLIGPKGRVVIIWAELIAVEMGLHVLRAFGYGHDERTANQTVRVVGDDVFLDSQDAQSSNAKGKRPNRSPKPRDSVDERQVPKTRILIRSDNLGVVQALIRRSSPDPDQSSAPNEKLWPKIKGLNAIADRILRTCKLYNMDLGIRWVRSKENFADGPSRASWNGVWNPRLGKGDGAGNGKKFHEEMVDWDVLQERFGMERVPDHLRGCLNPVGRGLNLKSD